MRVLVLGATGYVGSRLVPHLVEHGHDILIQAGAGLGSAIEDSDYTSQGARILPDAAAVFAESDMIVKVKEPQPVEVALLEPRHGQELGQVKAALSQLQMALVRLSGETPQVAEPEPENPEGPGPAQSSGRLWVPGQ